jgi:PAS domain S-box-containing protein
MQIRTKERLITIIVLAVIGLIAALIWWTYKEVDIANRQRQQASEIARELSQLRMLTFEYRLYRNERAKVRWYAVSNRVDRLIENTQTSIPTQDQLLASMREGRAKELRLFSELTSAETGSRADAPLDESARLFEGTLLSRLLAEQQNTFADVFRLTDIAAERINDAQRRLLLVALSGLVLIALTKGLASWLINHDVLAPIVRLQRATREIGAGNWNFKLGACGDDEMGRLGTSFNSMAERIEAQATALQRAHDELELRVKERTAELAQLAAIVESSDDAIMGRTLDGVITSWNSGAERMFGYSRQEALGNPMLMIFPPERLGEEPQIIARVARGESTGNFETVRVRKDGKPIDVTVTISPIKDGSGRIVGASNIARDITERRQADEALRARDAAQAANHMKSEFLANMSHELRTPLNGIIGFSEFLVDEKPGKLNDKQRDYLNDILNSGRHLLQLINDVLDLSKVEAGKMELFPEAFSLRTAVEEVCSVVSPMAKKKNIAIEQTISSAVERVTLDQQKFKQVMFNLLSNAVKFTDDGGRVEIVAGPHGSNQLRLQVRDTGIGIRPEDFGKLFVEFKQIDSGTTRKYEGTGLGLALTKKIVEFQNGAISVESEPGKGSTFTVILPRNVGKYPLSEQTVIA